METLVQIVIVALAVVAMIWHQQRSIDKLRQSTSRTIEKLGEGVAADRERLARIEGFLGIGEPQVVAPKAAGATRPKPDPGQAEEPGSS